jgi:protein-S-isoprenylcysteine O-methyltransferase Ste14
MTPRRINPPHYFLLAIIAMGALSVLPGPSVLADPWRWLGVVPVVLGIALAVVASQQFARAGTNIMPLSKSTALVTSGAFAFTRNPMYVGMILVLAGIALMLASAWPWLVPPAFLALLYLRFIRHEEVLMEATFGDEYRAYCAKVRRFI